MKKYLIGAAVTGVFFLYSFAIRHHHSKPIIPLSTSSSNNSSATGSGSQTGSTSPQTPTVSYKDGQYSGSVVNAYYGNIQVQVVVAGSKISTVKFLQAPNDNPNSIYVNSIADPYLSQETIKAQTANVSIISGATLTSEAFIQSLTSALNMAK